MTLTDRQRATIVAALRKWSYEYETNIDDLHRRDIATDAGRFAPLTEAEVDELADSIALDMAANPDPTLIRVLVVEPRKAPEVREIEATLEAAQILVMGPIESVCTEYGEAVSLTDAEIEQWTNRINGGV